MSTKENLNKMNIYYLRVLGSSLIFETEVRAQGMTWSQSGLYEFWIADENHKRIGVAYYPIERTIIDSVDYDVD